ncbi:LysR family substrate-binding domain-containing protein [Pollutimonas bauzanensis]|uniref:LysR family substrate-binding domain-containing protein n=1 Tax=Pollutimonas bauzanensis TaxID=658167 RepID=UPI0009350DF6|nr:LysR family substrate-binding domain-containing protein [Pollutimonas bauzanensis]
MVACIASSHRAAKRRRVSLLDLQSDNLFWFDRKLNPAYYDYCLKLFNRVGYSARRIPEPADHHILLGLIAEGQGIALVPKSLHSVTRKGVVFKQIVEGDQLSIRLSVAYQPAAASPMVLTLVAMLKERFSAQGASAVA